LAPTAEPDLLRVAYPAAPVLGTTTTLRDHRDLFDLFAFGVSHQTLRV